MKFSLCLLVAISLCVAGVLAKSECEKQRKRALKSKAEWIPECADSGEFEAKQCKRDGQQCMCVRPDGTHIKEFSSTIKSCDCHAQLDRVAARRMIGTYKPHCEEDGTYRQIQCHGSVGNCWCVDAKGKKTKDLHSAEDKC